MNHLVARLSGHVRETLDLPPDAPIDPGDMLYDELGFTSMDLLDLIFRVEEDLGVTLPRGTVLAQVRGDMPPGDFARSGLVTDAGREQLRTFLGVPEGRLPTEIETAAIPQYLTIEAFARVLAAVQSR